MCTMFFCWVPRVTVWRGTIPSLNLSAAAHLCMIYPLHYVSSSVSVVIALFFLVALYVCIYCIFSDFLLLLGGDIRTYTCVYASCYICCKVIVICNISPAQSHFQIHASPQLVRNYMKKGVSKRKNWRHDVSRNRGPYSGNVVSVND